MIISFIGHSKLTIDRDLTDRLRQVLISYLEKEKFISFYCGHYGDFDLLCAKTLSSLKEDYHNFEVIFITPYLDNSPKIKSILVSGLYDDVIYPPLEFVPPRYAISKRNEWMVDCSDVIITYVFHSFGGANKTLQYAHRKVKNIFNLFAI